MNATRMLKKLKGRYSCDNLRTGSRLGEAGSMAGSRGAPSDLDSVALLARRTFPGNHRQPVTSEQSREDCLP